MTVEYPFTLAQLAQILSALENERRNPNTKRNAIKAIERNAAQIGLTAEDVFDAADGLLSGRMGAAAFRAALRDESCGPSHRRHRTAGRAPTTGRHCRGPLAHRRKRTSPCRIAGPLAVMPRRRTGKPGTGQQAGSG